MFFESDPASNRVIISGLVQRSDLARYQSASVEMRLRMLGINFQLVGQRFDNIATFVLPSPAPGDGERDLRLNRPIAGVRRPRDLATKSTPRSPDNEPSQH